MYIYEAYSCPFCGGENISEYEGDGYLWCQCESCSARGPRVERELDDNGKIAWGNAERVWRRRSV